MVWNPGFCRRHEATCDPVPQRAAWNFYLAYRLHDRNRISACPRLYIQLDTVRDQSRQPQLHLSPDLCAVAASGAGIDDARFCRGAAHRYLGTAADRTGAGNLDRAGEVSCGFVADGPDV